MSYLILCLKHTLSNPSPATIFWYNRSFSCFLQLKIKILSPHEKFLHLFQKKDGTPVMPYRRGLFVMSQSGDA